MYVSTDGGKSWRYRSSIVQGGGRPEDKDNKGVWEPNVHLLDDGRLVAYYSSEQHKGEGYNQLLAHKVSADGGRSWGREVWDVAIPGGVQRPGMAARIRRTRRAGIGLHTQAARRSNLYLSGRAPQRVPDRGSPGLFPSLAPGRRGSPRLSGGPLFERYTETEGAAP